MKYKILVKPNYNIAFFEAYLELCKIELRVVLLPYEVTVDPISIDRSHKAVYIGFETKETLNHQVLKAVSLLSFFYELYQVGDRGDLKIMAIPFVPDFGDDLSVRLKYNGKTNETITRMMMNLALAVSDYARQEQVTVFDPMCGRGTTLFEAMISGYDACGVDRDQKAISELGIYITRYIKEARFKHTNKHGKLIIERQTLGELFELTYAKDKDDYKAGRVRNLKVLRGDTTKLKGAFRKKTMELLVVDLPYNVQHSPKGGNGLNDLLENGLKAWDDFMKPGAGLALAWNIYTDKREKFVEIVEAAGYEVISDFGCDALEHRVAQAITRDVIIARKR